MIRIQNLLSAIISLLKKLVSWESKIEEQVKPKFNTWESIIFDEQDVVKFNTWESIVFDEHEDYGNIQQNIRIWSLIQGLNQ